MVNNMSPTPLNSSTAAVESPAAGKRPAHLGPTNTQDSAKTGSLRSAGPAGQSHMREPLPQTLRPYPTGESRSSGSDSPYLPGTEASSSGSPSSVAATPPPNNPDTMRLGPSLAERCESTQNSKEPCGRDSLDFKTFAAILVLASANNSGVLKLRDVCELWNQTTRADLEDIGSLVEQITQMDQTVQGMIEEKLEISGRQVRGEEADIQNLSMEKVWRICRGFKHDD